jgi:hypothetical protein
MLIKSLFRIKLRDEISSVSPSKNYEISRTIWNNVKSRVTMPDRYRCPRDYCK